MRHHWRDRRALALLGALVLCRQGWCDADTAIQPPSASIVDLQHDAFVQLADRLLAAGKVEEAQATLKSLKERELADEIVPAALANSKAMQAANPSANGERRRFARYFELSANQARLNNERQSLEQKQKSGTINAAEAARLTQITTQLYPQLNASLAEFFAQLQEDLFAERKPGQDVTNVRGTESTMRSVVEDLERGSPDSHAVGLQYVATNDTLTIILVTAGGPPIVRRIDVPRETLVRKVRTAHELLRMPQSDAALLQDALSGLHALLIQPIESDLAAAHAHTLMILPGDELRSVPFSALTDGKRYLVQDYAVALFSDAIGQSTSAPRDQSWKVAGMGSTRAVAGLRALPAVNEELNAILAQPGIQGARYVDDQFNHQRLVSSLDGDFNVLHIASHFILQPGKPEASRLYLGDRSQLSLADVTAQDLRFGNFDLVTFSACETGVNDGVGEYGEELEGLAARVQRQGARAVLASLWNVYDLSTAQFMREFYRAHTENRANKAEALRAAQLDFIEGDVAAENKGAFKHPYYWAPFVLMGNWL
jgi:CHAT domain-containing protein